MNFDRRSRFLPWRMLAVTAVLLAVTTAHAQPVTDVIEAKPVILPKAEYFDLRSTTGINYRIFVAAPSDSIPDAGLPVIYLTDGNTNFPIVLGAAQRQVRDTLPCVVVGIGYASDDQKEIRQSRSFDLTPPTSKEWAMANAKPFADLKTGGHEQFVTFIEKELKPIIERNYKIDRKRQSLFGHSFGGLFTLHVLFTRPDLFQTYVAASPSIWWNDRSILQEQNSFLERHRKDGVTARLLLTVGELEQSAVAAHSKVPVPNVPPGRAIESMKEMKAALSAANIPNFRVESRVFPEEGHGSVILPAASRGVRFILEDQPRRTP